MTGTNTTKNSFGLIDSNLLVYAFDDTQGEKHAKAKAFLREKMAEGSACLSA